MQYSIRACQFAPELTELFVNGKKYDITNTDILFSRMAGLSKALQDSSKAAIQYIRKEIFRKKPVIAEKLYYMVYTFSAGNNSHKTELRGNKAAIIERMKWLKNVQKEGFKAYDPEEIVFPVAKNMVIKSYY